jgi:hypothetical protein
MLFEPHEGNYQLVQHQELKRLFDVNGLVLKRVIYTAFYVKDLLYAPLAALLWPWQWPRLRNSTTQQQRQELFGFKSLLHRHYVFIGEKPGAKN